MSAWSEIVNADGSDEWLAKCSAALVEVQAEMLRRARRRLEATNPDRGAEFSEGVDWAVAELGVIADEIDGGQR